MSITPALPSDDRTSAGVTLGKKPVRKRGRITGQHVIRQLSDGRLESATYPLYALETLNRRGAA